MDTRNYIFTFEGNEIVVSHSANANVEADVKEIIRHCQEYLDAIEQEKSDISINAKLDRYMDEDELLGG